LTADLKGILALWEVRKKTKEEKKQHARFWTKDKALNEQQSKTQPLSFVLANNSSVNQKSDDMGIVYFLFFLLISFLSSLKRI
jgi:hypothetical protein